MAPEMKFLHKYANCGTEPKKIAQVLERNRFEPTIDGFRISNCEKARYFFSQEDLERYTNALPSADPFIKEARSREKLHVAQIEDFEMLVPHVQKVARFLDLVMENGRGLLFYSQEIFKRAARAEAITTQIDLSSHWQGRLGLSQLGLSKMTLEDLVEIYGILLPLFDPESDLRFEFTKKCSVCGNYYQAKGLKAIYCSEKCRTRERTQRKKEQIQAHLKHNINGAGLHEDV